MVDKILADTSILIDLQKGVQKSIYNFDRLKDRIIISRITVCEFIYGAKNKKEKKINKEFIEKLEVIEISEEISKYTYFLLDKYAQAVKLGIADALIAATAIIEGLSFWTLNIKHFRKIKELKIYELK